MTTKTETPLPIPVPLTPVDEDPFADFYDLAGVEEEETSMPEVTNELVRTRSEVMKPKPRRIAPPAPPGRPTVQRSERKVIQPRSRRYCVGGWDIEVPVSSMSTAPEASIDMRFCADLSDRQGLTFIEAYSTLLAEFSATGSPSLNDAIFQRTGHDLTLQNEDNLTHFGSLYRDFLIWVQALARSERPDFPTVFPPLPWLTDVGMIAFNESVALNERYVSMGAENINFQTHMVKMLDAGLCEDLLNFQTAIDADVRKHPLCYSNSLCPTTAILCTVSDNDDIIMDMLYSQRRVLQINHSVTVLNAYQAVAYGKGDVPYIAPPSKARYPTDDEFRRYAANLKAGLNKIKPKRNNQ